MSLATLLNTPVTITRRSPSGASDEYGNDIPTASTINTVCELQQRQRNEPAAAGETSVGDYLAIFPAGTPLDTGDMATIDGQDYEVVGDPWRARNPRTRQIQHVEASLRRTGGGDDEGAS